ncbi:MAG: ATP-grasp domain-containing protein [Desulfatiglandales bacterium]
MGRNQVGLIALGSRLQGVPEVTTLGVRPNFMDYSEYERTLIAEAPVILYPTRNYAQFLSTIGKRIFPSLETYLYADEKIKQTTLFYMAGLPHPRTKIYYRRHHQEILNEYRFPFIAKLPRASAQGRGVFKIETCRDLEGYLDLTPVAYIQEYLPHERDLRVVLINAQPILAYWRVRSEANFRTNLFQGGSIDFKDIPEEALELAVLATRRCNFNDVGLDLIQFKGKWYLIEANMKYGRKGLQMKGMNLRAILREKLIAGELISSIGC